MRETELYEPVKNLLIRDLGCSEVYGEIADCDVVGKRGNYDVIVELKTSLNFKVILQAIDRLTNGAYTYIAVPRPKAGSGHFQIYHQFIKPHGIGLIYVDEYTGKKESYEKYNDDEIPYCKYKASISYPAKINHVYVRLRLRGYPQLSANVEDWQKINVGGSKGGETTTPYSMMIDAVIEYLSENGWSTIDDIINNVSTVSKHYKNPKASLRATLKEKWNAYKFVFKNENRELYYNVSDYRE